VKKAVKRVGNVRNGAENESLARGPSVPGPAVILFWRRYAVPPTGALLTGIGTAVGPASRRLGFGAMLTLLRLPSSVASAPLRHYLGFSAPSSLQNRSNDNKLKGAHPRLRPVVKPTGYFDFSRLIFTLAVFGISRKCLCEASHETIF
jgi:hypothetical protein